jgi:hypothetical protein
MAKTFVIGDRLKDEWISILDTKEKKLKFANHLAAAKEYANEEEATADLNAIRQTGYFEDLLVFVKDGDLARNPADREPFPL